MSSRRSTWEPKRWSEADSDAPEVVRAALQDARSATPDAAAMIRLAGRLGVGSGAAWSAAATHVVPGGAAIGFKMWAALSGVVAVGAVALVVWSYLSPAAVDAADQRALAASPVAPVASELNDEVGPIAAPSAAPNAADPPAPLAVDAAPSTSPAAALPPSAFPAERPRRRVSAPDATLRERAPGAGLDPQAELELLGRAQAAIAQSPMRALSLVAEHERAFPSGVFAQEREVIAIDALLKLRRSEAAALRARAFLSTFPRSTHAPRVQQLVPPAH